MNTELPILQIFNESDQVVPLSQSQAESILSYISEHEDASFELIELVYVNEEEIVQINQEYLDRDYVTDIISFRYDDGEQNDSKKNIEGTLFCCAPRISEQAAEFDEPTDREFKRIFIHGLLHLVGYEDDSASEKEKMTSLENKYLALVESNK